MLVHQLDTSLDWSYQQTATLSPRDSACALSACLLRFSFHHFPCFLCLFFSFSSVVFFAFSFSFFSGEPIHTMDLFLVYFGCKWYGMVFHSSLVSFLLRTTGTTVYLLLRTCLFCNHEPDFRNRANVRTSSSSSSSLSQSYNRSTIQPTNSLVNEPLTQQTD